jgi:hypothetical protein
VTSPKMPTGQVAALWIGAVIGAVAIFSDVLFHVSRGVHAILFAVGFLLLFLSLSLIGRERGRDPVWRRIRK